MVDFRPLAGLEYNDNVAGDFARLISPPYDVIDAETRARLAARSPYNIVRVILPESGGGLDKYASAGRLVRDWRDSGALVLSGEAFYVIEQRFKVDGRELVRTAVEGQLRLVPWREGVFPHEVTLPKPRADRLSLYRAARVQPGPVFSLFEDAGGRIARLIVDAKARPHWRAAEGPEGSFDRVWKVTDRAAVDALAAEFAKERFFIADGHHRYETALAYREEISGGKPLAEDHPANFVLMCAVPFDDPGLVILPTHRLLCGIDDVAVERGLNALESDYEMRAGATAGELAALAARPGSSLGVYSSKGAFVVRMRDAARAKLREEAGALMADLNVYEVRHRMLTAFFADVEEAVAEERIRYTHSLDDAMKRVNAGECGAAVVLAPLGVREMAAVASAGRTMPPKSTYFYPKLPTGVVIKPLE